MARTRREPRMHRHRGAGFVLSVYGDLPARSLLLKAVVRAEGGQMFSRTLRDVLTRHHGVDVGDFSYGSLLVPGFADVGTRIGRYVSIGPNVRRIGAAHPVEHPSMHPFWYNPSLGMVDSTSDVVRSGCDIGHDSWIGANAVILPNCSRIGTGAVIGAGSVVTKDIPDFAIAAGNPARVLRQRFTDAVTARVLDARPWDLSPADARSVLSDLGLSTEKSADYEDDGAARIT